MLIKLSTFGSSFGILIERRVFDRLFGAWLLNRHLSWRSHLECGCQWNVSDHGGTVDSSGRGVDDFGPAEIGVIPAELFEHVAE